jgi:hypothetical protein
MVNGDGGGAKNLPPGVEHHYWLPYAIQGQENIGAILHAQYRRLEPAFETTSYFS